MTWVLIAVAMWLLLAIVIALLVARSIGLADREAQRAAVAGPPNFAVDVGRLISDPAAPAAEQDEPRPADASQRVQPSERHPWSRGAGLN
jgi:hypothetical protein